MTTRRAVIDVAWVANMRDGLCAPSSASWDKLAERLTVPRPHPGGRDDLPGWVPAAMSETRRLKANVASVSCIALDLDNGDPLDRVTDLAAGYRSAWHTTWRHTPEKPRARVVFPLSEPCPADQWPAVWAAVARWAAGAGVTIDPQAKDASRLYFLPCVPPGGSPAFQSGQYDGEVLNWRRLLAEWPEPASEPPPRAAPPPPRRDAAGSDADYARRKLTGACERIASAVGSVGARHNTIRSESIVVGGYLWAGLSRYEAEDALYAACVACGKPDERHTVRDGLTHGEKSPLTIERRGHDRAPYSQARQEAPSPESGPEHTGGGGEPAPDPLSSVRAMLARCLGVLYAATATRDDRAAVTRELAGAVAMLADLAIAAPDEWSAWCMGAGSAGGFGKHIDPLRRTVAAAVAVRRSSAKKATTDKRAGQADEARDKVMARLSMTERGRPNGSYANIVTILKGDPRWSSLRMSELGNVVEVAGDEVLEGPATAEACEWLRDAYGIDAGEVSVKSAIYAVAQGRAYSPVRDYLERVRPLARGSGMDTIRRILPEILGITDATDLQRAMVGRFLISAVARAMEPGCKVDTTLVLVGGQGAKKSTFFKALFGQYFADSPIPIGNKDAPIQLSRVWGYEAAELEDLTSKRTAEAVKQFLGSSSDLYRPPFARAAVQVPRHTVLCGSSNPTGILTDPTGSRRFWILPVGETWIIPITIIQQLRDRIWSEALAMYGDGSGDGVKGERWWFDREEDRVREEAAQEYQIADDWQPLVERWLKASPDGAFMPSPGVEGNFTRTDALLGIGLLANQIDQKASRRVAGILTRLGWTEHNSPSGFRGSRVWRR